jgi:hypothetical protein
MSTRSTGRIVHARASEGASRWARAQSFGLPGSLAERHDGHQRPGRDCTVARASTRYWMISSARPSTDVAVLDDVLPAPKSPESAEVSAQESTQESVAVGEVSPKSL